VRGYSEAHFVWIGAQTVWIGWDSGALSHELHIIHVIDSSRCTDMDPHFRKMKKSTPREKREGEWNGCTP
jgi:hypothetical protein